VSQVSQVQHVPQDRGSIALAQDIEETQLASEQAKPVGEIGVFSGRVHISDQATRVFTASCGSHATDITTSSSVCLINAAFTAFTTKQARGCQWYGPVCDMRPHRFGLALPRALPAQASVGADWAAVIASMLQQQLLVHASVVGHTRQTEDVRPEIK
jgi:hypothetical protein